MTSRAARYQVRGERLGAQRANENMILEFHARYARPWDDTTGLKVVHRTLGNGTGVLLERDDFSVLSAFLAGYALPHSVGGPPEGIDTLYFRRRTVMDNQFTLRDLQQSAVITLLADGSLHVRAYWHGTGRGTSVTLSPSQTGDVAAWTRDRCLYGWEGWRSGAVPRTA